MGRGDDGTGEDGNGKAIPVLHVEQRQTAKKVAALRAERDLVDARIVSRVASVRE
ncbi:hypothetical protein [Numidum massiliense]|uniref:hypothetical protein n=1 Tax=Numidum massiliense TaxID=1522315 RepID=UPI0012FC436C|nr:hypothetical protein [Numidum massiliense]